MCIHWVHSVPMKDVGLRIRVQKELREQFLEVCRKQDKPAAQVIREFMREYVAGHEGQSDQAASKTDLSDTNRRTGQNIGREK